MCVCVCVCVCVYIGDIFVWVGFVTLYNDTSIFIG